MGIVRVILAPRLTAPCLCPTLYMRGAVSGAAPALAARRFHALLLQTLDPVLWDGDTSVDVPVHMDWRNNFEGAFRPERWLSEETKPRSYYIFGQGAHLCAGMVLVTLEVKLLLAMVLRKWRLQLEVPDMLARAELFPYTKPAKGTGGMRLIAREQPVA